MNQQYPIVTDIIPSQKTAGLLKNILYSQDGILTAHLSYMYQSWLNSLHDKTFGSYLQSLADSNGKILEALGNMVFAFGGDPNFATQTGKNWSVQYLLLSKDRNVFLKNAIQMEQRAIKDIDNAIGKIENESLKRLLETIKEDKENIVKDLINFAK